LPFAAFIALLAWVLATSIIILTRLSRGEEDFVEDGFSDDSLAEENA